MNGNEKANLPDDDLVRAARRGDGTAFRELLERYKRRAFGVALGIVGDPDEAEDVVQEAFVKAYYKLPDFRFGSNFYTWFYRLLVNQAIDRWRKAARRSAVPFEDARVPGETAESEAAGRPKTPEELAGNRQLAEGIARAIAALPEYHRAVILLREVEGMTYEEIARVLGCSVGTVMSRLHYARARLKEALQPFREG